MRRTVALAFSGGLDTSVCVKWLQEKYDAEVAARKAEVDAVIAVAAADEGEN
ncbi:MAG: argininosuccinate synthase [Nitrososphaerota archaeon]|nr:argininosuccinate synthase [Nitrososphaerota archaeon]